MPKIDRLIASAGPAVLTFASENGTIQLYSRESVVVDLPKEENAIPSAAHGPLKSVPVTQKATCSFTPIGEVEGLASLFPWGSTSPGTSIFGSSGDQSLLIQPINTAQKQVTFHAAGIAQMPSLRFSATDSFLAGDITFQMVGKNNTEVSDANRLFTKATNTLASNYYDPTKLLVLPYACKWHSNPLSIILTQNAIDTAQIDLDGSGDATAVQTAWNATANNDATVTGDWTSGFLFTFDAVGAENAITGSIVTGAPDGAEIKETIITAGDAGTAHVVLIEVSPWGSFETREGITVDFNQTNEELYAKNIGHYNTLIRELEVSLTAQPMGVSWEKILDAAAAQGTYSAPGADLSAISHNLDVIGNGLYFRLYGAKLDGSGIEFDASNPFVPPLTWKASRTITGGALDPLFAIDTSPIS